MLEDFYVGQTVMIKPIEELEATIGRDVFGCINVSPTFVPSAERCCGKRGSISGIVLDSAQIDFEEADKLSNRYYFSFKLLTAVNDLDFEDLPDTESLIDFIST